MKRIALLFVLSFSAWATTSVTVGVTNTQAVLTVHTDQTGSCTFKLSTVNDFSGTYSPVNDVNTTLFPGSDSCGRAFDIHIGNDYQIVAGKRAAETASDGKRYSRALQAYTTHYYQISVGSDTVTGQFTTANIPVGHTWNDPLPVDPNNPGQYAYPTLDFTDQTKSYIDPQTGALLKLLTLPGDQPCYQGNVPCQISPQNGNFSTVTAPSPWATASGILSDSDGGASATISASQNILVLHPDWSALISTANKSHTSANVALNFIQLPVNAWCSNSGDNCPAVTGDNRTVEFALTADNVTPAGTWTDLTLAGCSSGCTTGNRYTVGTTTPVMASWFGSAGATFDVTDVLAKSGNVTCDGSPAVSYSSGDGFGLRWGAGSTITINSIVYTLASLTDARNLTLTTNCPDSSGVGTWAYSANNFGILVRKKTTSTDTLFLQWVGASIQTGAFSSWDVSGDEESDFNCSSAMVAGPGGEMGYHCMTGNAGANIVWIGATTGNRSRIGALWLPNFGSSPDGWNAQTIFPGGYWDKIDGNTFYATATSKGGQEIIVKAQYSGSNADIGAPFGNGSTTLVTCGSAPCWTLSDLTPPSAVPPKDITTQVNSLSSDWANWGEKGSITITGFDGGYMMLEGKVTNAPSNDFSCFWGAFSTQTNTIVAFAPSWKYWPNRWASCHGPIHINDPTYILEAGHGYSGGWSGTGSNGNGPWTALITSGAVSSTGQACPGGIVDPRVPNPPMGNNCLQVTLDGAPCDPSPGPNEPADGGVHCGNAAAYYLQDLAPGDIVCISNVPSERFNNVPGCGDGYLATAHDNGVEYFRVLAVSGNTITLERGWYGPNNPRTGFLAKNAGASVVAVPGGCDFLLPFSCVSAATYWNFISDPLGQNGNSLIDYKNAGAGHGVTRTGIQASSVAVSGYGLSIDGMSNGAEPIRGVYPDIPTMVAADYSYASSNPPFGWHAGFGEPNTVDGHPAWTQYAATGQERTWFSDARPWLGAASDGGNFMQVGLSTVSGQLYKIATANLGRYHPKLLPTIATAYYHPLYDVSGPGSSITGSASDAYKRCTALIAGECDPLSSIGDVYVNPGTASANTFTGSTPCPNAGPGNLNAELKGVCVGDNGAYAQGITQSSLTRPNNFGAYTRLLTHAFSRYVWTDQFWNAKALPGGEWLIARVPWLNGLYTGDAMIKLTPFPNATSQPGGTYTPITIQIPGTTGDTVAAKFGYVENEPAGSSSPSLNCTSRKDSCYTTSSPTATVPFLWASEPQSWTSCGAGCTVTIPAIPGRILYYEIDRKNGATTTPGTVRALAVQ